MLRKKKKEKLLDLKNKVPTTLLGKVRAEVTWLAKAT